MYILYVSTIINFCLYYLLSIKLRKKFFVSFKKGGQPISFCTQAAEFIGTPLALRYLSHYPSTVTNST